MFSFVRVSENSMVASVRIARWLSNYLSVELVDDERIADKVLDTLIIINGAYGFCKYLAPLGEAIYDARRVIWAQNDYTIIPPKDEGDAESPFRKAFVRRKEMGKLPTIFWSTCEKWASRKGSHYVNWNMLTFDEKYDQKKVEHRRSLVPHDTLLYYGSFRDGSGKSSRVSLFDRYFRNPEVQTVISSPSPKFAERYPNCRCVGVIEDPFYAGLAMHGLGLYIEDRKSSEEFHSPANRFYEMLSAGLPMVFQPEAGSMLRRAGFDPSHYEVHNARDVVKFMERRETIGEAQRRAWIESKTGFRNRLISQVAEALEALP
jgi:hypothetical protein